jgi:hypothetical protein
MLDRRGHCFRDGRGDGRRGRDCRGFRQRRRNGRVRGRRRDDNLLFRRMNARSARSVR